MFGARVGSLFIFLWEEFCLSFFQLPSCLGRWMDFLWLGHLFWISEGFKELVLGEMAYGGMT